MGVLVVQLHEEVGSGLVVVIVGDADGPGAVVEVGGVVVEVAVEVGGVVKTELGAVVAGAEVGVVVW